MRSKFTMFPQRLPVWCVGGFLAFAAVFLFGCDNKLASTLAKPEYVQARDAYSNPDAYVNKTVRMTLQKVEGFRTAAPGSTNVPFLVTADDIDLSKGLIAELNDTAGKRWSASNLDEHSSYVVTVTGTTEKLHGARFDVYIFKVSDFTVHSKYRLGQPSTVPMTHEPTEHINLPLPELISDTHRIAVLAADYVGKTIQLPVTFTKDDLTPGNNGSVYISNKDVLLRLKSDIVRPIYDSLTSFNTYLVIGRVTTERDSTGRVIVDVAVIEKN